MAKRSSAQAKPIALPGDQVKTGKKDDTELTDDALSDVVGGNGEFVITKHTDTTSPV